MAQKDYIKKGKPKAAKRKPANQSAGKRAAEKNVEKPALPIIPLVVVGLILGGFGYFLWSINGAAQNSPMAESPAAAQITAKSSTKSNTKNNQSPDKAKTITTKTISKPAAIPPPQKKEDWQYIDELKNKTVEVAVIKVEKKGPFLMQCATFKDARRAEAFKAQLALLNFESRIKMSQGSNGTFHRVQLGPYETNRDAQRARHKLSKHKINGCKIWPWS
jgi:cell division protein FtsN